jgi:hypothetical protein
MAYWGAAVATYQNRVRGRGFIDKAHGLKKNVTKREQMYIDAFKKYLAATKLEKKNAKSDDAQELAEKYKSSKDPEIPGRAKSLLKDLESISIDFPEDLEAKAFIAHRIWYNSREGVPITSYLSTDLMIKEVLRAEPLHRTQIRRSLRPIGTVDCSHVAHARPYLLAAQTLRGCRVSTVGFRSR